jgi:hypothetical protein
MKIPGQLSAEINTPMRKKLHGGDKQSCGRRGDCLLEVLREAWGSLLNPVRTLAEARAAFGE